MKKVISAIESAYGGSNKPGIVSISRFSQTRFGVKRFSEGGETISNVIVEDEEAAGRGTEDIVESLPDTSEVAVFSDATDSSDEIIASVDGGSIDPEITTALSEGYEETTAAPATAEPELPAVIANCGDDGVISEYKKLMSQKSGN